MFSKKEKKEVYSSTDISDLLSSPIFYSVIALTFILGLSSIFGFFNNPRKLKTVVDVISQKILLNPNSNTVSFEESNDFQLQKYSLKAPVISKGISFKLASNPYSIFSEYNYFNSATSAVRLNKQAQAVSFDYDITSKQFWGNLDAHQLEALLDEDKNLSGDYLMLGVPLSSEYSSLEEGDKKYSMAAGLLRL